MARTKLTPIAPLGKYPATPVTAAAADITFTGADTVNNNSFTCTGRELLLVKNTDVTPHHVTIHSFADSFGRSGDITSYAVGAGVTSLFGPFATAGWQQSDGTVSIDGDDTHIQFAVITLPSI